MQRHYIQQNILKKLLKSSESTFTELNITDLTSDHLNFHIKQLLREGLIDKTESGYKLTSLGMEAAGRIDINSGNTIQQPKISISLGVFKNSDKEVLVLKRNRAQSLGQYAWLDKKWRIASNIENEIKLLLDEEAGLKCSNFTFAGATHVIRRDQKSLEIDAVLLNFKIVDPTGDLKRFSKDGENMWFDINKIKKVNDKEKLIGFNERLDAYLANQIILQEFISEID
jgi:hypothetical protein